MVETEGARISKAFKENLLRIAQKENTSLIKLTYNIDQELINNPEFMRRIVGNPNQRTIIRKRIKIL